MAYRFFSVLLLAVALLAAVAGCDSSSRYEFMSTVLDGYPRLPPPEEYCLQFYSGGGTLTEAEKEAEKTEASLQEKTNSSKHKPYAEKLCDDCHDKGKPDGLILPPRELCFMCHTDFIKGPQVHGPVAIGDCLACHLPHSARFPSLLKVSKPEVCVTCHMEKRLAVKMHERVGEKGLICADCHDPHYGDAKYFLK